MRLKIAIVAAAVPLIALIGTLRVSPDREQAEGAPQDPDTAGFSRSEASPERARQERPPPIEFPPASIDINRSGVTSADIEALQLRLLAAIAEDFRESVERDIRRNLRDQSPEYVGAIGVGGQEWRLEQE